MELDLHVIFFLVRRYAVTPSPQAPSRSTGVETVQIKELESPPLLPTLEALDAEFGCENEECADAPRTERGASMNGRFKPTQVEFPTHLTAGSPTGDAIDAASHHPAALQPSLGRRVLRKLGRLLVIFCLGVCSTLLWQSCGDAVRAMIAKSSPQLGWLAPHPAAVSSATSPAAAQASADIPRTAIASHDCPPQTRGIASITGGVVTTSSDSNHHARFGSGDGWGGSSVRRMMFPVSSASTIQLVRESPPGCVYHAI